MPAAALRRPAPSATMHRVPIPRSAMRTSLSRTAACVALAAALAAPAAAADKPLPLHPDNPRYFLFRGKPPSSSPPANTTAPSSTSISTYIPYLDELKARGFNLTRTFSGAYREDPGAFGIVENTLAPAPNASCRLCRLVTPGPPTAA